MSARDAYNKVREKVEPWIPWSGKNTPALPDDTITRKLQNNEIPAKDDVRRLVGSEDVILRSFYFNLALLHDVRRREGGRPYFVHVYSVAIKPDYRYQDPEIPAGYKHTTDEKVDGLTHETREEFGITPLGSHVVGETIKDFFGDRVTEGADYLTNPFDIVMKTIKGSLEGIDPEKYKRLEARDISERLQRELEGVQVDATNVKRQYRRIRNKLLNFIRDIDSYHPELSADDKRYITGLLTKFTDPLAEKIRNNSIAEPSDLAKKIRGEFGNVIELIDRGHYVDADKRLIHPDESPYLVTLDKTLYQAFVDRMNEHALQRALDQRNAGGLKDDSALSIPIVKGSDIIANVATMEDDLEHAMHVYRNARRYSSNSIGLEKRLEQEGFEPTFYQRLASVIDYANRILISVLSTKPDILRVKSAVDNMYLRDIPYFEHMLQKALSERKPQPRSRIGLGTFMW